MTLARLRVLLAGAELDLREMGCADPEQAKIMFTAEIDGDEVTDRPLVAIQARTDAKPRGASPVILLSDREFDV